MTKGVGWKAVNPQHPPSTYTHRYETTQREVRKRWCGGLWKVIRKVSNFLTFHLQIGYLGLLSFLRPTPPEARSPEGDRRRVPLEREPPGGTLKFPFEGEFKFPCVLGPAPRTKSRAESEAAKEIDFGITNPVSWG